MYLFTIRSHETHSGIIHSLALEVLSILLCIDSLPDSMTRTRQVA